MLFLFCANSSYFLRPQIINNKVILKQKLEMVEALADIELATKLMKATGGGEENKSLLDMHYESLNASINTATKDDSDMIKKYFFS